MPIQTPIEVLADHVQQRILRPRVAAHVKGSYKNVDNEDVPGWDLKLSSDIWVDPVTFTVMLMPSPVSPNWVTTTTGIYARIPLSDTTQSESTKWSAPLTNLTGDHQMHANDLAVDSNLYHSNSERNRAYFINFFGFNSNGQDFPFMECGWSSGHSKSSGVALRLFSGGLAEVWKDGAYVGQGNFSGGDVAKTTENAWTGLLLIPGRNRELLVVSTQGGGFSHVFEDLEDESTLGQVITPAEDFWISFPSGGSCDIQLHQMRYAASGTAISRLVSFANPPVIEDGDPTFVVWYDLPGFGTNTITPSLKEATSIATDFVPDGVKTTAYLQADLTGDNEATPFLYAATAVWPTVNTNTTSGEQNIIDFVTKASLSVGESADSTSFNIEIRDPGAVAEELDVPDLEDQCNRPFQLKLKDGPIIVDGFGGAPQLTDGVSAEVQRCQIEVRDRFQSLENCRFTEILPLDGYNLNFAIRAILEIGGVTDYDIETTTFNLPGSASPSKGDFTLLCEVGDSVADWLRRLFEDFAGTWIYGFRPTVDGIKFVAKSPEGLGFEPKLTLYRYTDNAIAALQSEGYSEAEARQYVRSRVYTSLQETKLSPEANEIRVTGYDRRTGLPIQTLAEDSLSYDPTVAPNERPSNWLGERYLYALFDSAIGSQEALEWSAGLLRTRLANSRVLAEIDCDLLIDPETDLPLWKGDVIYLEERGKYRIKAFIADFEKVAEDQIFDYPQWVSIPCSYTLEKILNEDDDGSAATRRSGAIRLQDMAMIHAQRSISRQVIRPRSEFLLRRGPNTITRV